MQQRLASIELFQISFLTTIFGLQTFSIILGDFSGPKKG